MRILNFVIPLFINNAKILDTIILFILIYLRTMKFDN